MEDDGCGGRLTGEGGRCLIPDVKYYPQHSAEGSCLDGGRDSIHPSRTKNKQTKAAGPPDPTKEVQLIGYHQILPLSLEQRFSAFSYGFTLLHMCPSIKSGCQPPSGPLFNICTYEREKKWKGGSQQRYDKSYFCQQRTSVSQTEENPVQNTAARISSSGLSLVRNDQTRIYEAS